MICEFFYDYTVSPEQNLANYIVFRAATDYRAALARRKVAPLDGENNHEIYLLEWFFCSEEFKILSRLNGQQLMLDLQKEAKQCP